ncbi:MAG: bifunctional phosphopantothenoylcysteine decarboxylase/phosphopantothenate--cysteine ligase CoaBC [Chitinophagales bacterium]|nr:bifunctional phosphopantothenoylcysteine decarboxylase/phosphopantothenate--cysteine ligase CoaBC [Chitinophagales bacterium]
MLAGKKILLGVCGSIAAYKSAHLVRLLVKANAEVKVLMTPAATEFITPLTLATLSKQEVLIDFAEDNGRWNNHVELGLWADAMVVAPASANTLAKLASGICDNLLSAVYLSARCPVFFSPAMDLDMWKHGSTQANLERLKSYGNHIIPVGKGELASGLYGEGRMAEPEEITAELEQFFLAAEQERDLEGKKVLITAGPTVEMIDPVRFISNYSTGKMGFALAKEFAKRGAQVTMVKGPTVHQEVLEGVDTLEVTSAEEMYQAATARFGDSDIAVLAAAVADYTPTEQHAQKIKKNGGHMQLELVKTKDILQSLGQKKTKGQILVGFALETENEETNARQKLEKKNLDLVVLNSLNDKGAGFGHDTNKITVIDRKGNAKLFELKSKTAVAHDIVNEIVRISHA